MTGQEAILRKIRGRRALVIGEGMLDRYICGTSRRLSPEGPVPVVAVEQCALFPGGAANTAANCAGLGAETVLVTLLGDDRAGEDLAELLAKAGVGVPRHSRVPARKTLTKTRVSASDHMLVRFDEGTGTPPGEPALGCLLATLEREWAKADVVVISDYGYGVLGEAVRDQLARLQQAQPRLIAIDSRDLARYRDLRPALVKPNLQEAAKLLGARPIESEIEAASTELLEATGAACVAVTMGIEGSLIVRRGSPPRRSEAIPVPNASVAGAGDTYLAAFALGLAAGAELDAASELAARAAAVVVNRPGTSTCRREDLLDPPEALSGGLISHRVLLTRIEARRARGERIVFTNGVFDLLHSGHVRYLTAARALGDLLVVALNSDASTARLKGPSRPINSLPDRAAVLSSLACVDFVTWFDEDTPETLIRALQPDVFVKGGDYTIEQLPEAAAVSESGGEVVILDYLAGHSTTGLIERVLQPPSRTPPERRRGRELRGVAG